MDWIIITNANIIRKGIKAFGNLSTFYFILNKKKKKKKKKRSKAQHNFNFHEELEFKIFGAYFQNQLLQFANDRQAEIKENCFGLKKYFLISRSVQVFLTAAE